MKIEIARSGVWGKVNGDRFLDEGKIWRQADFRRAVMRHRSLYMVMRYVHPAKRSKRRAVELLSKVPTIEEVTPQELKANVAEKKPQPPLFKAHISA